MRRSKKWHAHEEDDNEFNQINVTDENGHITTTLECVNEQPQERGFWRRILHWFTRASPQQQHTRSRSSSTTSR